MTKKKTTPRKRAAKPISRNERILGAIQKVFATIVEQNIVIDRRLGALQAVAMRIDIVAHNLCAQYELLLKRCDKQDEQISRLVKLQIQAVEQNRFPLTTFLERAQRRKAEADAFMAAPAAVPTLTDSIPKGMP
jgi:hypothetical protein